MTRYLGILLGAVLWIGCREPPGNESCTQGTPPRCFGNGVQVCSKNWLGADYLWLTTQQCSSPQVCRVDTAGPTAVLEGENGCFDPKAYCPHEGYKECNRALLAYPQGAIIVNAALVELYECALRPSDQTLQWSKTDCMKLVPENICYSPYEPVGGSACIENVKNCDPATAYCDGTVVVTCDVTITDRAVWNWSRLDCTSMGMVCRIVQGFARCANT